MFSPAARHTYPAALMRAAKLTPCVNWSLDTIAAVQPWAERFKRGDACSAGRRWTARCWLIRHTTAARSVSSEPWAIRVLAPAHVARELERARCFACRTCRRALAIDGKTTIIDSASASSNAHEAGTGRERRRDLSPGTIRGSTARAWAAAR